MRRGQLDRVLIDPSPEWFEREITNPDNYYGVRAIWSDGRWYCWPSHLYTHGMIIQSEGLPPTYPEIIEVYFAWNKERDDIYYGCRCLIKHRPEAPRFTKRWKGRVQ